MNSTYLCRHGHGLTLLRGNCVISVEVGGPQAFFDPATTHTPFSIRASPFQLRGLAAYVVNACVVRGGNFGGFATHKVSNLVNYLEDSSTDLSLPFRKGISTTPKNLCLRLTESAILALSAHFFTVTVRARPFPDQQPGNTHPSVAILIAEYLSNVMKGADSATRTRLGAIVNRMVVVSQKMRAGGNTPFWQQVPAADDKMTYECDSKLGAPVAADCAKVEDVELGADDDTFSVGAGVVKFLQSG